METRQPSLTRGKGLREQRQGAGKIRTTPRTSTTALRTAQGPGRRSDRGPVKRLLSVLTNPWARSQSPPSTDPARRDPPGSGGTRGARRWRPVRPGEASSPRDLVFLDVRDLWSPTIHTDRYRSVTWIHPNSRPEHSSRIGHRRSFAASRPATAFTAPNLARTSPRPLRGPSRPFGWCSSEHRRATSVGPPLSAPHTHHEESTQIAQPESEKP